MRTQGSYYFRGTEGRKDGRTEGRKAENYVPPLFFEKAGDNNYTCIKPQGMSVVDYCIIPHEDLNKYAEFTVSTVSDLITDINAQSEFAAVSKPDHSVLSLESRGRFLCAD